jgi:hypothetical protein
MQPLTIIVQNAVPPREIGVATSSATFFRQLGGTLGVAVFLSLLFSTLGENIKNAFSDAAPGLEKAAASGQIPHSVLNDQVLAGLKNPGQGGGVFASVQDDSSIISRMSPALAHPFKVGFADSMSLVLLGGGVVMLLAFLILLLMPPVELRATSASAAARAEDSAARASVAGSPAVEAGADGTGTDDTASAHRAPGETVVGEDGSPGRHAAGGRHAGPTTTEE